MSQLLSKDEVDALLKGVTDGDVPADTATYRGRVVSLDLTSQERSVRGRWPGLELVVDRFARSVRTTLGSLVGKLPAVGVAGLELRKLAAVNERLPHPVSLQLFRMPPLKGEGLLIVPPGLAALLFEVFFGGDARHPTPLAAREFSAIEQRVLERLGTRILHDLRDAWRPLALVEFALLRSDRNPTLAPIAAAQDLVLLVELSVGFEGGAPTMVSLCIPNAALDPIRRALETPPGSEREAPATSWSDRLRVLVTPAELELVAELGTQQMRLSEVLALKAGDVISLRTGREGPVLVRVEGRPLFVGAPGVSGASNAVRITATL